MPDASDWTHYERRAQRLLARSGRAADAGRGDEAESLVVVAAENLVRAAERAPVTQKERLMQSAREVLACLEAREPETTRGGGDDEAENQPWQVVQNTGVTLADVAGLEEPKYKVLTMFVRPMLDPAGAKRWRKKPGGGLLLYGPPGNGKTLFARAIAGEMNAAFLNISGSSLMSKWVGDTEKNIAALFDEAARHERCVLFFDETEALLPIRGKGSTVMDRVVPSMLAAMDGIAGRQEGLLLLGATNRPDALDPAALRRNRFEHRVFIGLPVIEARRKILGSCLSGIPLANDVSLDQIAQDAKGYSGADIASLCDVATDTAWDREMAAGRPIALSNDDMQDAFDAVKPSVSAKELARYDKFRKG